MVWREAAGVKMCVRLEQRASRPTGFVVRMDVWNIVAHSRAQCLQIGQELQQNEQEGHRAGRWVLLLCSRSLGRHSLQVGRLCQQLPPAIQNEDPADHWV